MIIDCILDRRGWEEEVAKGYTHATLPGGKLMPITYDPERFYRDIRAYGELAYPIAEAMDYGEEEDVRRELCRYILSNGYNPAICEYVNSRNWLS